MPNNSHTIKETRNHYITKDHHVSSLVSKKYSQQFVPSSESISKTIVHCNII
jgi:hypothetical protein